MRIAIFAYDDCMHSTIVGLCDVFDVAERLTERFRILDEPERFETCVLSWDGTPAVASNGRSVAVDGSLKNRRAVDILIIPGRMDSHRFRFLPEVSKKLRALHAKGVLICSICAGSCYPAAAGILNGRKATTHWNLIDLFRTQFPAVRWIPNQLLVDAETVITAGGVSSWQELALHLLARFGSPLLATYCSRFMLIEPGRNTQAPYQMAMFPKAHRDEAVLALQEWLETDYTQPITLKVLLRKAGMSERNLIRRFKKATGYTPMQYLQEQRLFKAKEMLEHSARSFEEITWAVGYGDANTFRQLFKKRVGMNPGMYRRRFSAAAV